MTKYNIESELLLQSQRYRDEKPVLYIEGVLDLTQDSRHAVRMIGMHRGECDDVRCSILVHQSATDLATLQTVFLDEAKRQNLELSDPC